MQQPQLPSASGQYGVPEVPQFVGGRSSHGHMLGISHDMPHHEPPQSQHLQQQLLQQSHSQPPQQQQQSVNLQVKTDSLTEIQSSAATRPPPRTTDGFEQMVPNSAFGDDEVLAAAEDGDRGAVGSRWPRQETLALLKIRSEMDASFRDASLKGPLWEEISRKLADLGYQRSAKKCKEKFENVQKYYKRTKDGRAGRQDGKSYRFFSQLEALHNHHNNNSNNNLHNSSSIGNNTNNAGNNHSHALSSGAGAPVRPQPPAPTVLTSNDIAGAGASATAGELNRNSGAATNPIVLKQSADYSAGNLSFSSESSEDEEFDEQTDSRKRKRGSSTTEKMMLFFEQLIKQVMERQESMQQKFLETIEKREQDRMIREEAWKRQEMARLNREHEIMAQERALAASRDTAFIAFFQKITGQNFQAPVMAPVMAPVAQSTTTINNTVPLPTHETHPARDVVTPHHQRDTTQDVNVDQTELTFDPNSSRWPKPEVHALIKLRTGLEPRYQDAGPKGPLWEEISAGMARLGYSRSSKRCKEKWENINKYYKKVKESNKKRPDDAKTCPYFHQLEQLYKKKIFGNAAKQEHPNQEDARIEQLPGGNNNNSDRNERQSTDGILVIVPPPGSSPDAKNSNANPNNNGPPIPSSSGAMQATFFTSPDNGTGADQRALKKPEGLVMDVMDMDDMRSAPQHQQQSVVDDYDDDKMDTEEEEEDSDNNSEQEHHNIIPIPTIATTHDRQPTTVVDHLPFAEFVHESRTSTTAAATAASSFMAMVHRFATAEAPEFKTSKA